MPAGQQAEEPQGSEILRRVFGDLSEIGGDLAELIFEGMQDPEILARLSGIELVRERRLARIQTGDLGR